MTDTNAEVCSGAVVHSPATSYSKATPFHDSGMRWTARSLSLLIESASKRESESAGTANAYLDEAEECLDRLRRLVLNDPSPVTVSANSIVSRNSLKRLRINARRMELLVNVYAGVSRLSKFQRYRFRGVSLLSLATQMSTLIHGVQQTVPQSVHVPVLAASRSCPDWTPDFGAGSNAFRRVMTKTQCTFAGRSIIWTAPADDPQDPESTILRWTLALRGFVEACRRDSLDGFLIVLGAEHGMTVSQLSCTTRNVLHGLASHDAKGSCDLESPETEDWHFSFGGERLFVIAMGPCYPADHSRYSFGEPYVFLLLQPDRAFDRAVESGGNGLISNTVRTRIRSRYARHGRPYDLSITLSPYEAHRFVKPLTLGDPPVRWWRPESFEGKSKDTQ